MGGEETGACSYARFIWRLSYLDEYVNLLAKDWVQERALQDRSRNKEGCGQGFLTIKDLVRQTMTLNQTYV